jgi:hypothetical protein
MIEVIIAYLLVAAVTFSITRDMRKSFSWPVIFMGFIIGLVTKGTESFK